MDRIGYFAVQETETLDNIANSRVAGHPTVGKGDDPGAEHQDLVALAQQILHGGALISQLPNPVEVNNSRSNPPGRARQEYLSESRQTEAMASTEARVSPVAYREPTSAESPSSRFTAVNGREPLPIAVASSGTAGGPQRRESEERAPTRTTPSQEKLTITTTNNSREEWQRPSQSDHPSTGARPHYQAQSNYSDAESSHKRKRSGSGERLTAQPSSTTSYHSHGMPSSKPPDSGIGTDSPDTPREVSTRRLSEHNMRGSYAGGSQTHYPPYNEENRETGTTTGLWYQQQAADSRGPPQTPHQSLPSHQLSPEDQQLREALQRDAGSEESPGGFAETSPTEDDERSATYQSGYGGVQMNPDHKKRKRNFSNRTKTGCMTCRRRKKKCDETRPECNNCIRGGFVCNGYPTRGPWPKTEQKQAPIPLQSKQEYEANAANQFPSTPTYTPQGLPMARREPLPGYRGQQLRVDPQHAGRVVNLEDDRPSATILPSGLSASPDTRMSAVSYAHTVFPTPISASPNSYPDRESYKRVPPLLDPSRQEHDTGTPQSAQSAVPHINILHAPHSNSPNTLTQQSTSTLQNTAQLSLSQVPAAGRPRTQKEEMLAGKSYFPFDRELVLERERCNAACWRFNSSTNPNNGVSQEERARQFRDILQPKEPVNISAAVASPISPSGYVGNNVVVEAPFTCDYGYNIHIGQDVSIGRNCTILDTCEVKIGDRCIIGPNVQIYTATLSTEPKRRLGSRGLHLGKGIEIQEDCWIGGGVTILPGKTIHKGSTVGAGSVVTHVCVLALSFCFT